MESRGKCDSETLVMEIANGLSLSLSLVIRVLYMFPRLIASRVRPRKVYVLRV